MSLKKNLNPTKTIPPINLIQKFASHVVKGTTTLKLANIKNTCVRFVKVTEIWQKFANLVKIVTIIFVPIIFTNNFFQKFL